MLEELSFLMTSLCSTTLPRYFRNASRMTLGTHAKPCAPTTSSSADFCSNSEQETGLMSLLYRSVRLKWPVQYETNLVKSFLGSNISLCITFTYDKMRTRCLYLSMGMVWRCVSLAQFKCLMVFLGYGPSMAADCTPSICRTWVFASFDASQRDLLIGSWNFMHYIPVDAKSHPLDTANHEFFMSILFSRMHKLEL
jgi:hypothetical protein